MSKTRRSQSERRAETQAALLESACLLFGEKGYSATSLEQISAHCGLTIRPIYHYFGNKHALFTVVTERMEARILEALDLPQTGTNGLQQSNITQLNAQALIKSLRKFLDLCLDPHFRQVVLIDGPAILGRERWSNSAVSVTVKQQLLKQFGEIPADKARLLTRMLMAALAEVGLSLADTDKPDSMRQQADELVSELFTLLIKKD